MSMNLFFPSIKYVFVSYYLTAPGCRHVVCKKYTRFFNSVEKHTTSTGYNSVHNFSTRQRPNEPPWRIIFFGTDQFSLTCLKPLHAKLNTGTLLSGLGVVSSPGSSVYKFSESEKLPIYSWPPDDTVLSKYDMGIVVSYGRLIPESMINSLPLGILNVHGSLLPRWRGAAPIVYAIMNGDSETGVTIMRIKPRKFDVGDIVRQYRCSISPNDKTPELTARLANHAGPLLMECIRDLPRCLDMAMPQPEEGVTYAPKISDKLSSVDWNKMSGQQVYDLYRAISYKYSLSTTWCGKPIRLSNIELEYETLAKRKSSQKTSPSHESALKFLNSSDPVFDQKSNFDHKTNFETLPGLIKYSYKDKIVKVQCADGKWIRCGNFKISRPIMTSKDFYNGFLSKKDPKDWYFR